MNTVWAVFCAIGSVVTMNAYFYPERIGSDVIYDSVIVPEVNCAHLILRESGPVSVVGKRHAMGCFIFSLGDRPYWASPISWEYYFKTRCIDVGDSAYVYLLGDKK